MGSALLRELQVSDLITGSEESYIQLAIAQAKAEALPSCHVDTALPAIMQYSFSYCLSPNIAFSFEDVPHSCRKCCSLSLRTQWQRKNNNDTGTSF
ncbi:hypothetical protein [Nostoc commune]|uniref:hypothetical protein n=1 Tax=Nostoc commune TaxID=1178 RepID=UPI002072F348|nr:hypothetical protein [Nostoc commune]